MNKQQNLIDQAVNWIIRPPRRVYNPELLPLAMYSNDGMVYNRHSVALYNHRNQRIVGSIYLKKGIDLFQPAPCVIYLHGNSSSQKEGKFLVPNICSYGAALFCFDFTGSGNSDGDYISLGHYESEDLQFIIHELSETFKKGPFALWGRSMGASTAVLTINDLIKCKVVDSAYTSINDVCTAIATNNKVPSAFCPGAIWILKLRINGIAKFDISKVSPLKAAKDPGQPPLLICAAIDDEFVPFEEGKQIFAAYSNSEKEFVQVNNGHNGSRGSDWINKACTFILKHLDIQIDEEKYFHDNANAENPENEAHFKSFNDMLNQENNNS